jgi:hypothetical protein
VDKTEIIEAGEHQCIINSRLLSLRKTFCFSIFEKIWSGEKA